MKVYVLFSTEFMEDCSTKVRMRGVFSTVADVIAKVKDIEINDIEYIFGDDEPIVENHNNGYLEAHLNDGFHELYVDYKEVEVDDNDVSIGIANIL